MICLALEPRMYGPLNTQAVMQVFILILYTCTTAVTMVPVGFRDRHEP